MITNDPISLLYESNVIGEASAKDIKLPEVTSKEVSTYYKLLSDVEQSQLGTEGYMDKETWARHRKYMLQVSKHHNPKLDESLTAYTPGETLKLLAKPEIKAWFAKAGSFKVPNKYDVISLVPCAKTKPWAGCKRGIYKSYNKIKDEYDNIYFATISEPLGIVPMDMWSDFPQYDNPGLFKDPAQRNSMFKSDWIRLYGRTYKTPFDVDSYKESITILSEVINSFISTNKDIEAISFVDDKDFKEGRTSVGTHSDMLNQVNVVPADRRFKKRSAPRTEPYGQVKDTLTNLKYIDNDVKLESFSYLMDRVNIVS